MKKIAISHIVKGGLLLLFTAMICFSSLAVVATHEKVQRDADIVQQTNLGTYFEGFESYGDFVIDFPPWTQVDYDEGPTWGMEGVEWENVGYTGSFMIFNPSQTTPPLTEDEDGETLPHSGNKFASCWNAITDYAPNDDWLISPLLPLESGAQLTFWGKSINDMYGLEEIEVGISTTDTNPSSFDIISGGGYIEVPPEWTEYTFDLSSYNGQSVYIAIHVVSWDIFAFFLDDFEVTGVFLPEPDLDCEGSLEITRATPDELVTVGSFTVQNIGQAESQLAWAISDTPDWGTNWTFSPAGGSGLTPTDAPVTVQVSVVAPSERNQEFSGEIIVVNAANENDFNSIPITLSTPKSNAVFIREFLANHPLISNLLARLSG